MWYNHGKRDSQLMLELGEGEGVLQKRERIGKKSGPRSSVPENFQLILNDSQGQVQILDRLWEKAIKRSVCVGGKTFNIYVNYSPLSEV